jgi:hypothetical protein
VGDTRRHDASLQGFGITLAGPGDGEYDSRQVPFERAHAVGLHYMVFTLDQPRNQFVNYHLQK